MKRTIALLALFWSANCLAQDEKPGAFFPKNYVGGEVAGMAAPTPVEKATADGQSSSAPEERAAQPARDIRRTHMPGKKILGVVLFVKGSEPKQTVDAYREFLSLKNFGLELGHVVIVGDRTKLNQTERKMFRIEPGVDRFEFMNSMPTQYGHIRYAPAWDLELEDGHVVVQGAPNTYEFINQEGQFVEPVDRDPQKSTSF